MEEIAFRQSRIRLRRTLLAMTREVLKARKALKA